MGFFKWIIIIAIIIGVIYFFFPNTYHSGKDFITGISKSTPDEVPENNYDNPSSSNDERRLSDYVDEENTEEINDGYDESDPCNWDNQAKMSTGGLCTDTFGDVDLLCLENPPIRYGGVVDLVNQDSYPLLKCCESTGLCAWR